METTDDVGALFGGGGDDIPDPVQAGNLKRTAEPVKQVSDVARRRQRRRAASVPRGFAEPTLGVTGLLGIPRREAV